jgi:hypothetical protein
MKRLFLFGLPLLCVTIAIALAQMVPTVNVTGTARVGSIGTTNAPAPPATYLVEENFEGAGAPTGWTSSGTVNWTNQAVVLQGTQSLKIDASVGDGFAFYQSFASTDEIWAYIMFRTASLPANNRVIMELREGTSTRLELYIAANGKLTLTHGAASSGLTSGGMTTNVLTHIWTYYKKGTGANGLASVEWATDGIRLGSGANYTNMVNGAATTGITTFRVKSDTDGARVEYFDRVLVDDTVIGSNP